MPEAAALGRDGRLTFASVVRQDQCDDSADGPVSG
ncbi:hypothetical protein V1290_007415 [Bradyrhizobium sp. AZCC 1578]